MLVAEHTTRAIASPATGSRGGNRWAAAPRPDRYGDRWAPVLVGWATAAGHAALEGDVAGVGGSTAAGVAEHTMHYVTGQVTLDRNVFADEDRPAHARAIVLHELGHLVGLAHVDHPRQLMHDDNTGQTRFAAGDLQGLAALGAGDCFPAD